MTTTIVPATGAGALFTQQGVGTSPGFSATDERRSNSGGLQEGVLGSGASAQDFMAQQRIAGANMSVDITMPTGGFAYVQGDTITGQGLYCVPVHSANINEIIGTADPTNPRIDQIILEVQDNVLDASGGNLARTRVVAGTATGGANLTNRTGAAALPGSALLLADVLVGAAAASITNSVIRDRRKWARGAYSRTFRTGGANLTTTSASMAEVDATNLKPRLECSGAPLRVLLMCSIQHSIANGLMLLGLAQDGTLFDSSTTAEWQLQGTNSAGGTIFTVTEWHTVPSAGSHQISPQFAIVTAGTMTIFQSTGSPATFVVQEMVQQNTANNTVTTG